MADAKKCDRCGAFYLECEPNPVDELARVFSALITPPNVEKQIYEIEKILDLCPSCSRSLKKWAGVKEGAEYG